MSYTKKILMSDFIAVKQKAIPIFPDAEIEVDENRRVIAALHNGVRHTDLDDIDRLMTVELPETKDTIGRLIVEHYYRQQEHYNRQHARYNTKLYSEIFKRYETFEVCKSIYNGILGFLMERAPHPFGYNKYSLRLDLSWGRIIMMRGTDVRQEVGYINRERVFERVGDESLDEIINYIGEFGTSAIGEYEILIEEEKEIEKMRLAGDT